MPISAPARPGWITTATASWICSSPTTCSGRRRATWCSLDGATKSYCTPESYKGTSLEALSQSGRRQVRRRQPESRYRRSDEQVAGRRGASITTAMAGPTCSWPTTRSRTSYTATTATARLPRRAWPQAWPSAKTAWRAAPWAWTPRITIAPGGRDLLVGNFSNQMLGLYHNEGTGLFVDEAPSSTVGRASLLTLTFGALLLRLRSGRLSRYLRGQRSHRRGNRPRAAEGAIQGAAAAVP